jgi:prepilin-type N-terminal cleavage/methylation domain-containing protein
MRTQNRAFSLVEVLIAIVVLALGLLGIAAVFPAVVSQQRQATDTVLSTSIENAVTHYLKENSVLNKASVSPSYPPPLGYIVPNNGQRGWQLLSGNPTWSAPAYLPAPGSPGIPIFSGNWKMPNADLNTVGLCLETATGNMRVIGAANSLAADGSGNYQQSWFDIPLSQRLSPTPYSSSAQPLYVWDFVARRVGTGNSVDNTNATTFQYTIQDDAVQLAVFVRRIDSGIRRPAGATLADTLVGGVAVPVAEDPTSGRPTFDGLGGATPTYSGIHTIKYALAAALPLPNRHDLSRTAGSFVTLDTSNALRSYARQPGQQMVDNFGVVHTVTAFLDRDPADLDATSPNETIEITPPIDLSSFANWSSNAGATNPPSLLFTTQIPTSVFVITVPTPIPGSTF